MCKTTMHGFGHLAGVGVCANRPITDMAAGALSHYLLKRKDEEELPLRLAVFSMGECRNKGPTRLPELVLASRLPRPSSPVKDEEREVVAGGSERLPFKGSSPALRTREGAC